MKKISILFAAILLLNSVYAFNILFMGQVNRGFFFGGSIPDCYITPSPTTIINPYFGVTVTANIVQNANTTAVINSLGGNPVSVTERCLPNGNLAELGCSLPYAGYPDDYVGALEYAPTDLITSMPLRCEMYRSQGQAVLEKPAFYHRLVPNTSFVQPGIPGPSVTITLSCPSINVAATPSAPTKQITHIWVESAPVQGQNPIVFTPPITPCGSGSSCALFGGPVPPGTAHVYARESNGTSTVTTVNAIRC